MQQAETGVLALQGNTRLDHMRRVQVDLSTGGTRVVPCRCPSGKVSEDSTPRGRIREMVPPGGKGRCLTGGLCSCWR